jgi:hypothetical protein
MNEISFLKIMLVTIVLKPELYTAEAVGRWV